MEKPKRYSLFFRKAALLLLPVYAVWFLFVEFMPDFYNEPNNMRWSVLARSFKKKEAVPDVRLLFLGESRVNAGIDITQFDSAWSYAAGGATSIEIYFALKKHLALHPKPDTVFLSVSPRFLTETFAFYPYAMRNDFFTHSDIAEIYSEYSKNENDTTLGNYLWLKFYLHKANWIEYYQSDIARNYGVMAYFENKSIKKDMQKRHGAHEHPGLKISCSELNYETNYQHFTPAPIMSVFLRKTLQLCADSSIFLHFQAMPMNVSSVKKMIPAFVSDYKAYMRNLQSEFPKHHVSDTLFAYPDSCFGDDSHLNERGKILFTKELKEKLMR